MYFSIKRKIKPILAHFMFPAISIYFYVKHAKIAVYLRSTKCKLYLLDVFLDVLRDEDN